MAASRRHPIRVRAGGCCEYCHVPDECDVQPFQLDHIRAQKHSGRTTSVNLAWACLPCNSYKGPNVAGYDPESLTLQPLFNPREDVWSEHFSWYGPFLVGLTAIGRTTIEVLRVNLPDRAEHRRLLMEGGQFRME